MFDLKELDRWQPVTTLRFPTEYPRKVRLEVLAEDPAKLFVEADKKRYFIGEFMGYDVVQFAVPGVFTLTAKGGPVKIWTSELDTVAVLPSPDAVSFTKIMTRRARNPELEGMMHVVQQNMERRLRQVENDVTLRLAQQRRAEIEAERKAAADAARAEAERAGDGGDDEEAEAEAPS